MVEEDELGVGGEAVVGLVGEARLVVLDTDKLLGNVQDALHAGVVGAKHVHYLVSVGLPVVLVGAECVAPHPDPVVEGHDRVGRQVPPREQAILRALFDVKLDVEKSAEFRN